LIYDWLGILGLWCFSCSSLFESISRFWYWVFDRPCVVVLGRMVFVLKIGSSPVLMIGQQCVCMCARVCDTAKPWLWVFGQVRLCGIWLCIDWFELLIIPNHLIYNRVLILVDWSKIWSLVVFGRCIVFHDFGISLF
jgi:hypothetical protein